MGNSDRQCAERPRRGAVAHAVVLALGVIGLAGCTTWTPQFANVTPVTGPAPYANRTPMQAALVCLQPSARATPDLRLGVADFIDGSGASLGDGDVNGRYFSQRPDLMLIVALSKTGVRLVNRTSTAVAEWEMRQAMDRRLGEGKQVVVGQTKFDYRPVRAGEFLGSTFYINGAITEINWSLSSNVEEGGFLGATAGRRTYRVSIAIDLVVTNSLTTEVVFARSYSKQLVGYESGAGVFRFVEASIMPKSRVELFQANIGQKQNEPVQAALRWLVELSGYETVSALTGGDARCDALVPGQDTEEMEDDTVPAPPPPVQARADRSPGRMGQSAPFLGRNPYVQAAPIPQQPAVPVPAAATPVAPLPAPVSPVTRTRAPMQGQEPGRPATLRGRAGVVAPVAANAPRGIDDDAVASVSRVAASTVTATRPQGGADSAMARQPRQLAVLASQSVLQAADQPDEDADAQPRQIAPVAAAPMHQAPAMPLPVPPAPAEAMRVVLPGDDGSRLATMPDRAPRLGDSGARDVDEEASISWRSDAPVLVAGRLVHADGDSRQHLPPAPTAPPIEGTYEPPAVQPEQPSGRMALMTVLNVWLSASAAPAPGSRAYDTTVTARGTGQ